MNIYVSIQNFGSDEQKAELVSYIVNETLWHAVVNPEGNIVLQVKRREAGALIEFLADDPKLNWIEFTVQFEH